jgi:Flp pilus assembly protein TadB
MKDTLTVPGTSHRATTVTFKQISFGCLLVLASLLALAGGLATSVLFFGLLLAFSLLLVCSRLHSRTNSRRALKLPAE